jgi:DnaJ-class molecular chaperone
MLSAKPIEHKCPACNGTGFPVVKQPAKPGRRIYPVPCKSCHGKGRITEAAPTEETRMVRRQARPAFSRNSIRPCRAAGAVIRS